MTAEIRIDRLANHRGLVPLLAGWFEREWPSYYGTGRVGSAEADLRAYASYDSLPIGIVALRGYELLGFAALKVDSITSRPGLGPWAGAGLVHPQCRREGIGAKLLAGLENVARQYGIARIYCATSTSASLLERGAWRFIEHVEHEGERVAIYDKAL